MDPTPTPTPTPTPPMTPDEALRHVIIEVAGGPERFSDDRAPGWLSVVWADLLSAPLPVVKSAIQGRLADSQWSLFLRDPEPEPTPVVVAEPEPPSSHEEWAARYRAGREAAVRGDLLSDPSAPKPPGPTYAELASAKQELRKLASSASGFGSHGLADLQ
jgi:hypothetical protein